MVITSKIIEKINSSRHPLVVKMSLWVTTAVVIVTLVVFGVASEMFYTQYEEELDESITQDVNNYAESIPLVMQVVTEQMNTAREYIGVTPLDGEGMDSLLTKCLLGFDNTADQISIIYPVTEGGEGKELVHERTAIYDDDDNIILCSNEYDATKDNVWIACYHNGTFSWSTPFKSKVMKDWEMLSFNAPLVDENGKTYAVLSAAFQTKWVAPEVFKYKTNKEIDISIYSSDGQCIIPKADNIMAMADEDLIIEERELKDLGWRLVFCTPKAVIYDKVNQMLLAITVFACLLLVTVIIAILLSVVYVARPFILSQQELLESKGAMQREMDIAAETQRNIVPHIFPPYPERKDIDLYAMLEPALNVGGDLYDYYIHDERLHFCIGDVSGKGVQASLFMSATRYLFRSLTGTGLDLALAVENINRSLCTDNASCTFVTFFYGSLDLQTGILEYCNAGHNPPLINGTWLDASTESGGDIQSGMPLGVFEEAEYTTCKMQLQSGDTLLLYTDGVTEAMSMENVEFGNEATRQCAYIHRNDSAQTNVEAMLKAVRAHATQASQSDDITMLCVKYNSPNTEK